MAEKRRFRAVAQIDPGALAEFQAGIRKRYSDEQILDELRASAGRLGRSPTMREFADEPGTTVHPQTVIEHFGSWNAAKRAAGLVPRRFAAFHEPKCPITVCGCTVVSGSAANSRIVGERPRRSALERSSVRICSSL